MAVINLVPVLDALTGVAATTGTFKAEAMRAGRRATRVTGSEVTFPTELTAAWDGTGWDAAPQLHVLPTDCYWKVRVAAASNRLERTVILPSAVDVIDFGDLIDVTPDTGQPDPGIQQWLAVQQYIANQVGRIDGVAATIFDTVGTVQAQIDTAATATQQAAAAAADAVLEQAALAASLADVTTNTQAATDAATQAALDRAAADADAAATAADRTAVATDRTAVEGALAGGTVQDQIDAAVNALVNGAPGALNTLKELADAIGDDSSFAATVTNALAQKANLASLAAVALSGAYTDLTGRPTLATVATSGAYSDLTGKPVLGTAAIANATEFDPIGSAASAQSIAIQRANHTGTQPASTVTGLATVATSGAYPDLTGRPTLGTAASAATGDFDVAGAAATVQAYAIQRVNHTGIQSADTITDGTTNKAFLATERTKLAGITSGATANQTDAYLLARANHTGTQPASTITGLATVATSGVYTDLTGIPTVIDGNA